MKRILENLGEGILAGILMLVGYFTQNNLFYILAILAGGTHQLIHGVKDMIEDKSLNIDLLMVLAAIGTIFIGHPQEGATLIFIFAIAHGLEHLTLDRSKREIESLMSLQPQEANRITDTGSIETVPVESLKVGDVILVRAADTVPIDGVIVEGESSFEEAMITGESVPRDKAIDDRVYGGTLNISASIKVKVDTDINDTMIKKIVKMVDDSQNYPSKVARKVDNFEKSYSNLVVLFSVLVVLFNIVILKVQVSDAFYKGITLLVVASPCALAASVTPATLAAISNSAKNGVLVKGGVHLENLKHIKVVAFDKTGTLTKGSPSLNEVHVKTGYDKETILSIIKTMESHSNHPLALAIVDGIKQEAISADQIKNVKELSGRGIQATYNNKQYFIGRRRKVGLWESELVLSREQAGKTLSFIYEDDTEIGFVVLEDEIRKDSKSVIEDLNEQGIKTVLITGDNEITAKQVSNELGVSMYKSEVLPDEKASIVRDLEETYGATLMIGDGINDAPALANASIGVAMGGGTDIAMETADIVFVNDEISNITNSFKLSNKLEKIVKQNIILSMTVISLLVLTTLFGNLGLPMGVIGHEGSTIIVILNGLRMLKTNE